MFNQKISLFTEEIPESKNVFENTCHNANLILYPVCLKDKIKASRHCYDFDRVRQISGKQIVFVLLKLTSDIAEKRKFSQKLQQNKTLT